jgi:hypothetical protein
VKIFIWQLAKGGLPSKDQILRRHGPLDERYALGGQMEVDHIFVSCILAKFVLSGKREMFGPATLFSYPNPL